MSADTLPTTKPLKDLGWHLRGADPQKDKGSKGWVYEHESGLKTRVMPTPGDAIPAARKLEAARHDPSADLRDCPECLFTYDTNDPAQTEEHAEHGAGSSAAASGAEEPEADDDPMTHEAELAARVTGFLTEQGVEVSDSGLTQEGASYLVAGGELVEVVCGRRLEGLGGHIKDAMRRRVAPLHTACVVACCAEDPSVYESDVKIYGVDVLTFERFEESHTPALSDIIIERLGDCETLPDFQKLVEVMLNVSAAACTPRPAEALFYLHHGPPPEDTGQLVAEGGWNLEMPAQHSTADSVVPVETGAGTATARALIEVHSHHSMRAEFSAGDDGDELGWFRVYAVIGNIFDAPEIRARVTVFGHACEWPASEFFELPPNLSDALGVAAEYQVA